MSRADATAAGRYARAIFELGVESGDAATLVTKIGALASVYRETPELRNVFGNPQVQATERDAILRAIAGRLDFGTLELNVVRYLARRRRLQALPEIAERLARIADERSGIVRATVTAALPLPESFYERLIRELEVLTGQRILLERRQDPSLIAGVVTRIGDNTIDGSLGGWLDRLGNQLEAS
jgi:F-type H+-transporting ATPase subunit delta